MTKKLSQKNGIKYFGVTFDQDFSGLSMASLMLKKINAKLKFLYRNNMYFGFKERKLLVSTLVQSNFDYGVNSWFRGLPQKVKTRFQTTQNRLIRYILNYDGRHHLCSEDFNLVGWLNVNDRIEYLSLCLMYKIHIKKAPAYLCDVKLVSHSYNTRKKELSYIVPKVKSHGQKTFKYCSIKYWNSLPLPIRKSNCLVSFKSKCKKYYMDHFIKE